MALETVVFQQDPFSYACKDLYNMAGLGNYGFAFEEEKINLEALEKINTVEQGSNGYWESPPSSIEQSGKDWEMNNNSSPEIGTANGCFAGDYPPGMTPVVNSSRRKRRRTKSFKNKEEMENQRMTHIAVERNRRRQMNDYLAVLRSMMPPSYAQRGDQASIVGGAINFVKELEQLLQFLEGHKEVKQETSTTAGSGSSSSSSINESKHLFSNFFTFPQYSTCPSRNHNSMASTDSMAEKLSTVADVEVTMVESHANIKVLSRRRPKQLLKMVTGLHSMCLTILHLNITTVDQMVLYSFSVKVEDECQLTTVNEIASAVHELVGMIKEEAIPS